MDTVPIKIVGMLRVKNEARWIATVIRSIQRVCDRIVVLDDHSDDGTPEICDSLGARVLRSPFQGLDETRDKNYLLEDASACEPESTWYLHIDGDEELDGTAPEVLRLVQPHQMSYSLPVFYLWNCDDQVRVDGVYGRFWRPSLFRRCFGLRFSTTSAGHNFHCGNVPRMIQTQAVKLPLPLWHYGYRDAADRLRKFDWYNQQDPNNYSEDCYRHMVQGDVPAVPPEMTLRHAGPLQIIRRHEVTIVQ